MPLPIPQGNLVSPIVVDPTGKLYLISCDAAGNLLVTALTDALKASDLNIEAVSKDLQVDVKSSALPTDAATQTTSASLLAELLQKLETADLNIEAVSKDLQVDVKSSALPTDAATQTTSAALLAELLTKLETADLKYDASGFLKISLAAAAITPTVNVGTFANPVTVQGKDGGAVVRILLTDVDGKLIVNGGTPSIFHPLPVGAVKDNLNLPVGTSSQTIFTAPANQTFEIYAVTLQYIGTVAAVVLFLVFSIGGVLTTYNKVSPPVSSTLYVFNMDVKISNGDYVYCYVTGATAGDDFHGWCMGARII